MVFWLNSSNSWLDGDRDASGATNAKKTPLTVTLSNVSVGEAVGDSVGDCVGGSVCDFVGVSVGAGVVGGSVGDKVGVARGVCVGVGTNSTDGAIVGETASPSDGAVVRADVGDGTAVCAEIIGLGDGDTVSEAG